MYVLFKTINKKALSLFFIKNKTRLEVIQSCLTELIICFQAIFIYLLNMLFNPLDDLVGSVFPVLCPDGIHFNVIAPVGQLFGPTNK